MSSNLPPGCRVSDIPGWRPEDEAAACPACGEDTFPGHGETACEACGELLPEPPDEVEPMEAWPEDEPPYDEEERC